MNFVSSVTQPSLEEIAASTAHPKIFQLYIRGGLDWCEEIIQRVKRAGYMALCLTVDTAHYSRRERQMMNRWLPPNKRTETTRHFQATLTWEMMAAIKKMAGLPFILKGVSPKLHWIMGSMSFISPIMAVASSTTAAEPWTCFRRSSKQ
jgi:isopentenyl diphosphate isomerase/L-lactate dehydrogenase-like FMN-dependent dehydrogenase